MRKLGIFAAVALLTACSKDIQTTEAVRQGVLDYLEKNKSTIGVDPAILDVAVSSVSFAQDQARATVAFTPKNVPGGGGMTMSYVLNRDGNKWVVKGREVGAGNAHGAQGLPPAGSQNPSGVNPPGANQ